jgi:hypothetical protein
VPDRDATATYREDARISHDGRVFVAERYAWADERRGDC